MDRSQSGFVAHVAAYNTRRACNELAQRVVQETVGVLAVAHYPEGHLSRILEE